MESAQCHLVFLSGPQAGQARTFHTERVLIGRAASCDLQFDPYQELSVASQHAEILLDDEVYTIHDLGSRSGTFLNGERIARSQPLRNEDYLQFGRNGPEVIFRLGAADDGLQPLPPEVPPSGEVEVLSGADEGKVFHVHGDQVTRIGRRNDLEIPLDPRGDMIVSGNHCSIAFEKGVFTVADTSRNGTFVNGAPVRGRAYLNHDDIVTLGEGGPRLRFRLHPPQRVYPNRVRRGKASYSPVEPEPAIPDASATESFEPDLPDLGAPSDSDEFEGIGETDHTGIPDAGTTEAAEVAAETAPLEERPMEAPLPDAGREQVPTAGSPRGIIRPGATLGALLVRVLLVIVVVTVGASLVYYMRKSGTQKRPVPSTTEDYAGELRNAAVERCPVGHFQYPLPREWAKSEDNFCVSIESTDKKIAVDYVRDPRLSAASVQALFAAGGHTVVKNASGKTGDVPFEWYVARGGSRASFAVLLKPAKGVPALALLVAPMEIFQQLPDEVIASLCITGFKLQDLPISSVTRLPAPPATPVSTSPTGTAQPTPVHVTSATPRPTPPESVVTEPTPTPAPSPALNQVNSRSLGLVLELPAGWTGTADEKERILKLASDDGIQISIGRDPQALDSQQVFGAMKDEGWTVIATNQARQIPGTSRSVAVADMTQGERRLRLYLLDQPNGTTIVVYAIHEGKLKPEQWTPLTQVVGSIALQTDVAAPSTSNTRD